MAGKFSLEAIFSATDKISAPLAKIKSNLGAFGRAAESAVKAANKAVDKGLSAIGRFSTELGIAGVASIAGIGLQLKDVITKGAEFEAVLVKTGTAFEAPAKKGTKAFADLVAAARDVGRTTEFSALQGAEGLNSLATAGYSLEQSIGALPKVIDFASAGQLELGAASDIASDTLGAFSLRSADAATNTRNMARVMDSMVRAAADSTTNVTQLAEGVKMGGAFASTSGQSIEEFVAMLGVLANAGIKGSEAGTAIRNSFLHLTDVTPDAAKTMKRLGIQIAKTKAGAIDMPATIGRFAKATENLTKAQKAEAIASVFGAYTVGPFLNLMNAGEGTIRKFAANLENATGTAKTMADTMRNSTQAKIQKFFNTINDVKLGVFEAISGTVLQIADSVGKWVSANQDLINTKADEWAIKLRDALPEIWTWTERITKALAAFMIISAVVKAVTLLTTVIGALSTAFAWAEFTALLLGTTIGAVVWPILLIGAAVAGLVALLWAYWPEISGFFSGLYDWAVGAVGRLWDWVKGAFGAGKAWLVGVLESIKKAFATVAPYVVAAFEFVVGLLRLVFAPGIEAVKWYISMVTSLLGAAVDLFTAAWAPLSEWYATLWGGIVETQKAYFGVISGIWSSVFDVFSGVWSQLVEIQRGYFDAVVGIWSQVLTFFTGIWQGIADGFMRFVGPIIDKAKGIIDTIRTVGRLTLGTADSEGGAVGGVQPGPQVVSPSERNARDNQDTAEASASVDGKIVVEARPGTKATARAKPNTVPIETRPSGAFG